MGPCDLVPHIVGFGRQRAEVFGDQQVLGLKNAVERHLVRLRPQRFRRRSQRGCRARRTAASRQPVSAPGAGYPEFPVLFFRGGSRMLLDMVLTGQYLCTVTTSTRCAWLVTHHGRSGGFPPCPVSSSSPRAPFGSNSKSRQIAEEFLVPGEPVTRRERRSARFGRPSLAPPRGRASGGRDDAGVERTDAQKSLARASDRLSRKSKPAARS